jgi:hypothetical protein
VAQIVRSESLAVRFRINGLLSLIFVVAFGLGALMRPSGPIGESFVSFVFCILLAVVLASVARRGDERFFWIGFTLAGLGYLWCVHVAHPVHFQFHGGNELVSTRLLE